MILNQKQTGMAESGLRYRVLLVSAAAKTNAALLPFFSGDRFEPVTVVETVTRARRKILEREYDMVIINTPLPDDFGRRLAVDLVMDSDRVVLLLVRNDIYADISLKMISQGVLVAQKPMDRSLMEQLLNVMCSVRERLRGLQKKTMTLEEKMEEIRLVNRAKWSLIKEQGMSEEEAHRYIQKRAMDLCMSKKEMAESILSAAADPKAGQGGRD